MGVIQNITSIEQSKKLAKFLGKANHCWLADEKYGYVFGHSPYDFLEGKEKDIPCWSLSALLDLLPGFIMTKDSENKTYRFFTTGVWSNYCNTPIDAAVDLVFKLHEKNLI